METNRAILIILDGWGIGPNQNADAIATACTPFYDKAKSQFPFSTLVTHGEQVGLPEGQMGNSEVGHLNIGAGRVVWQELARINKAIKERELHTNRTLLRALNIARNEGKALHFIGLVSDGGVHSHIEHLKALCDIAKDEGCRRVLVHAFTDGRDCDPKSGAGFVEDLMKHIEGTNAQLASVVGRYYAMDRDKRWERVKLAYDLLINSTGEVVENFPEAIRAQYKKGVTDEFLKPMRVVDFEQNGAIAPGDVVVCFNFRTDRCREITQVLTQTDMPEHQMKKLPLHYITMTRYDDTYQGVEVIFEKDDVRMTLGETLEKAGKTQLRVAETEKYPHVTFFFSGGREEPFKYEKRIMIPSPKVATYDLQPEMSAYQVTEAVLQQLSHSPPDFICLNFANCDMVGHTGVFEAAVRAAEVVDECTGKIVETAMLHDYACLIIADHGNADQMINEDGSPNTAHTKNPVPCLLIKKGLDNKQVRLNPGTLADIAPTVLTLMGIPQPAEMTGKSLVAVF